MTTFVAFTPAPSVTAARSVPTVEMTAVAPRYDAFARDIALGPDGEPVYGNPWEALADEALMGILIRRAAYPEFPPDFGNVFDLDARQPGASLQQAAFRADITAHFRAARYPEIASVGQFAFAWGPGDRAQVSCTITPVVGPSVPVDVFYRGGR